MNKNVMLMRFVLFCLLIIFCNQVFAQDETRDDSSAIVTNSFDKNWFVQVGVDMSLQNPYGSNFMNVFPNGKSFGVDVAVGKWLTPVFGVRGKMNWEAGIIKSDHAKWINTDNGYLIFSGDILLNLKNLLGEYDAERKWNFHVFPRAGAFLNMRNDRTVGSPLLGLGVGGTYRLNENWRIYGDIAYQMTSNVIGNATGVGDGTNGYFDINVGVQLDLGHQKFHKVSEKVCFNRNAVVINSFWDNWFLQAGLGMSLLNPYGANFAHVIPNGNTIGLNVGIGKWLTPEFGIRGGANWQNGIVGNKHLSWIDRAAEPGSNYKRGGYLAAYADAFFNLHHIFGGYDAKKFWNAIVFPRAGVDHNFDNSGSSALVGIGTEQTFRLNDRMKLFADVAYQVTSGDFYGEEHESSHVDGGSNGWFDINIGVQYELGQVVGWNKPNKVRDSGFRVQDGHNWPRFIVNTIGSVGVAYVGKTALKAMIKEERPDHSDNKSFPSGHAAIAFAAARSIDKEFRRESIWIPIAGYAAATAVGIERIASDKHHWYDVVAGAGIGLGAAELTWWLSDIIFPESKNHVSIGCSGNTLDVAITW